MVVDKDTKESIFFVRIGGEDVKAVDYGEPIISANPPICSPRVSGDMRKGASFVNHVGPVFFLLDRVPPSSGLARESFAHDVYAYCGLQAGSSLRPNLRL